MFFLKINFSNNRFRRFIISKNFFNKMYGYRIPVSFYKNHIKAAIKKHKVIFEYLRKILYMRLDNIILKSGFNDNIKTYNIRILIKKGFVKVNDEIVRKPSYIVNKKSVIKVLFDNEDNFIKIKNNSYLFYEMVNKEIREFKTNPKKLTKDEYLLKQKRYLRNEKSLVEFLF